MKGLLFTPKMAQAVMDGRKTQTRRVVPGKLKLYEEGWSLDGLAPRTCDIDWCQYEPGETVCLLTTWAVAVQFDGLKPTELSPRIALERFWHAGMNTPKPNWAGKSRPGRFLPNILRHLMPSLKIVDVDVQRVRQISETDAMAEGVKRDGGGWIYIEEDGTPSHSVRCSTAHRAFRSLWNSINAARGYSWARNPQVFVIKFDVELPF